MRLKDLLILLTIFGLTIVVRGDSLQCYNCTGADCEISIECEEGEICMAAFGGRHEFDFFYEKMCSDKEGCDKLTKVSEHDSLLPYITKFSKSYMLHYAS